MADARGVLLEQFEHVAAGKVGVRRVCAKWKRFGSVNFRNSSTVLSLDNLVEVVVEARAELYSPATSPRWL
jgi:hypothetical protein